MNNKDFFLKQLDGILAEYNRLLTISRYDDLSDIIDSVEIATLLTKSISTIERIAGSKSEYFKSIQIAYTEKYSYSHTGLIVKHVVGIVKALKDDLTNDYLKSLSELIHADVFADYMEMSSYLLEEGYKDPAAVIAGSTLESHLRKLCLKYSVEVEYENGKGKIVPKKADRINSELAKEEVYSKTNQKQITAWLDIRNNAAHGKYEEYTDTEVKLMISGILNFMQFHPA